MNNGETDPMTLRILVTQEGDWFVAQCLEIDLGAEAKSLDDVMYEMQKTIVGQLFLDLTRQRRPFEGLPSAPEEYFQRYQRACAHSASLPQFHVPQGMQKIESSVRIAAAA